MSESSMRGRVIMALKSLDACAIENSTHPGTPDVNYMGGWVELKCLDRWPVREGTPVRIRHFTREQRIWLARRWNAGGNSHLLLQVRDEWLLFDGNIAAERVGKVPRMQMIGEAARVWLGPEEVQKMLQKELQECLSKSRV